MKYQEILSQYLEQKKKLNPRYSLRAFSQHIGLSPSKLSEVINSKKALSAKRAEIIARKLGMDEWEQNLFLLSIQAQHGKTRADRFQAEVKIESILSNVSKFQKSTAQRAAWYFSAVEYLLSHTELTPEQIQNQLNITVLQFENATRLIRRIKADRKKIQIEPLSSVQKWLDIFVTKPHKASWDDCCLSLNQSEQQELISGFQELIKKIKDKRSISKDSANESGLFQVQVLMCQLTK